MAFGTKNQDDADEIPADQDAATLTVLESLREEGFDTANAQASSTSHGYGADAMALYLGFGAVLTGVGGVIMAGEKIEKGIAAWIRMGKQLIRFIDRTRKKDVPVHMSQPLAAAYALAIVSDLADTEETELLSVTIARVRNGSLTPEAYTDFSSHRDRYYICTIQTDTEVYVLGLSASGKRLFQNRLSRDHMGYFF